MALNIIRALINGILEITILT